MGMINWKLEIGDLREVCRSSQTGSSFFIITTCHHPGKPPFGVDICLSSILGGMIWIESLSACAKPIN